MRAGPALGPLLALGLGATGAAAGCGAAPEPCTLADGSYHILVPDGPGPHPAVVFLHGHGGSGLGTMRNSGMVQAVLARGYAVVAPDGQTRPGREGMSWAFHPDRPATRNEGTFLRSVATDAARRFDLDRDTMLLAGFSVGGSMVSYVACADPGAFAAYAPVAGSFWRPHPAACAGPVRLLHTHGWADRTVPLEGRQVGSGFVQGDVFAALGIWRETNGCPPGAPDTLSADAVFQTREWTTCTPGSRLGFALHPGGHDIPEGWATLALDWFEALP